jgi:ATP-dependent helicase/nuclease subunit B
VSEIQPTLEVAASTRVLRERRRAALAAASGRVVLGRSFLTLRGLAEACVAETGSAVRGELDGIALARLARHCADGIPALGALVENQPGMAGALAATLRDLRDAGVPAAALPDSSSSLRSLYTRVEEALARLEEDGLLDRIGLFRLAQCGAAAWIRRIGFQQVDVYGATELVGSAGDLIETIGNVVPVRVHQPDWGSDYTRELRETSPWRFAMEPTRVIDDPALAAPGKTLESVLRCTATTGPREELEFVAQEILRCIEAGAPPAAICVVARTLEPYAPWLESVFIKYGIPFTSSLAEPLLRTPFARVRLDLARAIVRRLEREPTLELLRSPRFHWQRLNVSREAALEIPQLAECLARRGRVRRGAEDWLRALRGADDLLRKEARARDPHKLKLLSRILSELDEERDRFSRATSWEELIQVQRAAERSWLREAESDEESAVDALADTAIRRLARLDHIDRVCGCRARSSEEELLSALAEALAHTRRRPTQADTGGVRILDALQARAVPSEHLFILGLNHESWPLELREDAFLSASVREHLRKETGRPLPIPRLQEAENRFLLGLLLSQARRSVSLTWHVRDAAGRARAPSMYLHDLPFVAAGAAGPGDTEATHKPPTQEFPNPTDALVDAALTLGATLGEKVLPALASEVVPERAAHFTAGLELIRMTDARKSRALPYDGVVTADDLELSERFAPNFLELLGQCPQRAFFARLLKVRELETPPLHELDSREAGTVLHGVLRRIYADLYEQGDLAADRRVEEALEKARAALPAAIALEADALRSRLLDRHRALWEALERQLQRAATDFLERDLRKLLPAGLKGLDLEEHVRLTRTCDGRELHVEGKADRILELASRELRVGDYKTRADPRHFLSPANVKKGIALQVPLYVLAVGAENPSREVAGEVLAVPLRPERDREEVRTRTRTLAFDEVAAQAPAALDTLARLLYAGSFPFRRDTHCRHCPYIVACRKAHPPSEERVRTATPFAEYFALHGDRE